MTIRTRTTGLAATCALLLSLVLAGQAHAFIYYSQAQGPGILRTNQDGSGQINLLASPGALISRIAVDANHIYWVDRGAGSIGRANLDGSAPQPAFIAGVGSPVSAGSSSLLEGIAVDSGHIYWTVGGGSGTNGSIGRANLDGTGATTLVNNITAIEVAVDANHLYWSNFGAIGRANLDGTAVDQSFVNATPQGFASAPLLGLAVDSSHLYWTNSHPLAKTVGRANIDGTAVNTNLVVPGGTNPNLQAVAVDSGHLYWADPNQRVIGRAGLDGANAEPGFVTDASQPGGVAVDNGGLRSTSTSVSCSPAVVIVAAGSSTCTATVTDTAAGPAGSPPGVVTFDTSHPFDGAFLPSAHCTLTAGAGGTSTCSLSYFPQNFFNAPPRTDVISATYAPGDTVHDGSASSGAGNVSLSIVLADTTAPLTSIARNPGAPNGQNGWYVSAVHATVSATDDVSGVAATRCVLDPAVAPASYDDIPAGCAYTGSGADVSANGQHVIYAASIDAAGNKGTPVSSGFKIDTVAPNTTITGGPASASTSTTPSFSFASTEAGSSFQCSLDGGVFSSCTSPKSTTVGGGAHTFAVRAIDPAGNVDATPATTSFRVCTGLLGGVGVLLNGILPNTGLLCS